MAYEIVWTNEAIESFDTIITYLLNRFSENAVRKFVKEVDNKIELIKTSPNSYRKSRHKANVHYTVILRKTILVYRIIEEIQQVQLIHFWDGRQQIK